MSKGKSMNGEFDEHHLTLRFSPIRLGLCNIYKFDNQEFPFYKGKLLVKGNNATGKSRVLALIFPFLFDGDVTPYRLEPDGDTARKMEWHLHMDRHNDRTGYVWLELARVDADGTEHFMTIGCGLSASRQGRNTLKKWFFITTKRVGMDLFLLRDTHPLTRSQLEDTLGFSGSVFQSAKDYRAELDNRFFQLGESSYGTLMDLLIKLRQPQLTREFDEDRISGVLSGALASVSPHLINQVADSFKSIDDDRRELEKVSTALNACDHFSRKYRLYARAACRQAALTLRDLRIKEITGSRDKIKLEGDLKAARENQERLEHEKKRLIDVKKELQTQWETWISRPEMKEGAGAIDNARERAKEWATALEDLTTDIKKCNDEYRLHETDFTNLKDSIARSEEATQNKYTRLAKEAAELRLMARVEFMMGLYAVERSRQEEFLEQLKSGMESNLTQRHNDIRTLKRLNAKFDNVNSELRFEQRSANDKSRKVRDADEQRQAALEQLQVARDIFEEAVAEFLENLRILEPNSFSQGNDLLNWLENPTSSQNPLQTWVEQERVSHSNKLNERKRTYENKLENLVSAEKALRAELDPLLAAGGLVCPPGTPFRNFEVRAATDIGAPLWQLCEFRDEVEESNRARIEGALLASGLLDAWVSPHGLDILNTEGMDLFIDQSALHDMPSQKSNLLSVLKVESNRTSQASAIDPSTIELILSSIGLNQSSPASLWVDNEGNWSLGALKGRWVSSESRYIGSVARMKAREQRIAELNEKLLELDKDRADYQEELQNITDDEARLSAEVSHLPTTRDVINAFLKLESEERNFVKSKQELADQEAKVLKAAAIVRSAQQEIEEKAEDWKLPKDGNELDNIEAAHLRFGKEFIDLCQEYIELWRNERRRDEVDHAKNEAAQRIQTLERRKSDTRTNLTKAEYDLNLLESTIGQDIAAAEVETTRLRNAQQDAENDFRVCEDDLGTVTKAVGKLEIELGKCEDALKRGEDDLSSAYNKLQNMTLSRILSEADDEFFGLVIEDHDPIRLGDLANSIVKKIEKVSETDLNKLDGEIITSAQKLANELAPLEYIPRLSRGPCGMLIIRTSYQGAERNLIEMQKALKNERERRQLFLTEREKNIISDHLLNDLAAELGLKIQEGNDRIKEISSELEQRALSTGMRLRLRWRIRDDDNRDLASARSLLLKAGLLWSDEERSAIRAFIKSCIDTERARSEVHAWNDQLTAALDYRQWHRVEIERNTGGESWVKMTKKVFGTGSGGEKATALTLPMYAAACAYYKKALPTAPRLIALDEAFVALDNDMRKKCMGLIDVFDLDLMMTSEREWGTYSTNPGISICQLKTHRDIDAIYVDRWIWNGREKIHFKEANASRTMADQFMDGF